MTWACGPAKVPPEKDFPPVEWGTNSKSWEERVRKWRARPAKERRGCSLNRQTRDPTMLIVGKIIPGIGEVRWSDGHGVWSSYVYSQSCSKRGYWSKDSSPYDKVKYIGESIEDLEALLDDHVNRVKIGAASDIEKAERNRVTSLRLFKNFEEELVRPKILDLIVADLERATD
jgi:hypothetical protein